MRVMLQRTSLLNRHARSLQFQRSYASNSDLKIIIPSKKLIKEQSEYKQLPEDSRFVESYFDELKAFRQVLANDKSHKHSNFTDFEHDPNGLIAELEKYIQTVIYPQFPTSAEGAVGERIIIKRYDELLRDFKITLMVNGGHPFVFDLLMSAKEALDKFDKLKSAGKK